MPLGWWTTNGQRIDLHMTIRMMGSARAGFLFPKVAAHRSLRHARRSQTKLVLSSFTLVLLEKLCQGVCVPLTLSPDLLPLLVSCRRGFTITTWLTSDRVADSSDGPFKVCLMSCIYYRTGFHDAWQSFHKVLAIICVVNCQAPSYQHTTACGC